MSNDYDPILIGLAGAIFLLAAETGGIIQSFNRKTSRSKIDVYDGAAGADTGFVSHNPKGHYDVKIITTGNAGIMAAAPGVAVTLANVSTGNGVTSGGIYTDDTTLDHPGGQLQTFAITATQSPAIS